MSRFSAGTEAYQGKADSRPSPIHETIALQLKRVCALNEQLRTIANRLRGAQPKPSGESAKSSETPWVLGLLGELNLELGLLEHLAQDIATSIG